MTDPADDYDIKIRTHDMAAGAAPVLVRVAVAKQSKVITSMVEDLSRFDDPALVVPLQNVPHDALLRIIALATRLLAAPPAKDPLTGKREPLRQWETAYFRALSQDALLQFAAAANYLDMPLLLDAASLFIAAAATAGTPTDLCALLGFAMDLSAAEQDALREATEWTKDVV